MAARRYVRVALCVAASISIAMAGTSAASGSAGASAWSVPTSLPTALSRPALAVGHDGDIYVFGGFTTMPGGYRVTNTVYIYNPRRNAWGQGTTMPVALEGASAVTLPDGRIAVLGGGTGCFGTQTCTIYQIVQVYDPRAHSWCLFAPMTAPRYRFAAVLGPDGRLYAIGGWNGRAALASVEAYDLRRKAWRVVAALPQAEEGMAAVVTHGRIAVMGGFDGGTTIYNDLFVFNGHRWNSGAPMPTARNDLGAATNAKGHLFAVGGYDGNSYTATVERYDPSSDSWTRAAPLPRPLAGMGVVSTAQGRIYVMGGWNGAPSAQVAVYGAPRRNPFTS